MNRTDFQMFQRLEIINVAEVKRSAYLITYLCIIAVTGLPGNVFVCLTNKPNISISISRYFIFWLGVVDAVGCGTIGLELVTVSMPYVYPEEWLCKLTIYSEVGSVMMSAGLLTTISIDRYRMVCKPHGRQIRRHHAFWIIVILFVLSVLFSLPALEFYGKREFPLDGFNTTGQGCQLRNSYDSSASFRAYSGFLWMCFTSSLVIMVILYTLIGRQIVHRFESRTTMAKVSTRTSIKSVASTLDFSKRDIEPNPASTSLASGHTPPYTNSANICQSVIRKREGSITAYRIKRSVFIMFLISAVFVVSFVPYLTLRAIQAGSQSDFVTSMTDSERTAFKFFLRFYFLNFTVNPFIYGACLPKFRKDINECYNRLCMALF